MAYRSEVREQSELLALHKRIKTKLSFEQWLDLRDRSRKDLWFLFHRVLRRSLAEQPQRAFCEVFPKLNFDGVYHPDYTLKEVHAAIARQCDRKEYGLLAARGSTKSTVVSAYHIQWMLNVPDIRILILTATKELSQALMQEIKQHLFLSPKGGEPTDFHKLFPEYVIHKLTQEPLTLPCRVHTVQKEPTLWINSIDSSLSGWHCDLFGPDDMVDDKNSLTIDMREKLHDKFSNAQNLLDEWGFLQVTGTRYDEEDEYKRLIDTGMKFAVFPAMTPKPGKEHLALKDLREEDVDLLFPEKLTFASLSKKLRRNEKIFLCQQMQAPPKGISVTFDEDVLHAHLIGLADCPRQGRTVITWDTAAKDKARSDLSAGVVGRLSEDGRELYILEIVFDRYRPSELPIAMVKLAMKWHPDQVLIEEVNGSEFLKLEIMRVQQRMGYAQPLRFLPVDTRKEAKANRVKNLEILLSADRLWFATGAWIDETFSQFLQYEGVKRNHGRRDDIPDAIAQCAKHNVRLIDPGQVEVEDHTGKVQIASGVWVPRAPVVASEDNSRYFAPQPNPTIPTKIEPDDIFSRHGLDF